jgi:hypothetical protein
MIDFGEGIRNQRRQRKKDIVFYTSQEREKINTKEIRFWTFIL